MKSLLTILLISKCLCGISQKQIDLKKHFETSDLLVIAKVTQALPDILQDDVGTSYGSVSIECINTIDLKSNSIENCPSNTYYSLIYLSTNGNKRNIHLEAKMPCIAFLKAEKTVENEAITIFSLTDENSIIELTPTLVQQLIAKYPSFNHLNLYEFIR
jgi:hypothetical protein